MPGQQHSQPTPTSLCRGCMRVFGVICQLHYWQLGRGSFTCHRGNTGVERTPNKSQHRKLTLEKKILQLHLPGFELATFRSRVWHSCQQAIPAPYLCFVYLKSVLCIPLCVMSLIINVTFVDRCCFPSFVDSLY